MGARERVAGDEVQVLAGVLNETALLKVVRVPSTDGARSGRLLSVAHAASKFGPGSMTTLEIALPGSTSRVRVQSSTYVTVVTR